MTIQPRLTPPWRWLSRVGPVLIALGLILVFVFTGCVTVQLNKFNNHAARGDYEWIAAQVIECKDTSNACGQLHLIKGDACFRLAKDATARADKYACAADALEQGLASNRSWPDATVHRQFQENLCESLTNLQSLQSGEAAEITLARFATAAKELHKIAPDSVPAIYYLATVRLRQVQPVLFDMTAADRMPVCNRLKRNLNRVLSLMESAKQAPLPNWDRFADRYQRLSFDLGLAMRIAECR